MKELGLQGELLILLLLFDRSKYMGTGLNTLLQGFPTRNATAVCTFAYSAGPGTDPVIFEGRTEGKIVPPRGAGTFGWNPIFEAKETGKT